MNSTLRRGGAIVAAGLIALVSLRVTLHTRLYKSGFEEFCADDCIRVEMAYGWAKRPHLILPRESPYWPPFHSYIIGLGLMAWDHLLFAPRLLSIISGLVSIIFIYCLAQRLLADRAAALLSALLVAVNPVHLWLSSVPLSESFQFTALAAFLYFFVAYRQSGGRRFLYLASAALALGGGIRFEVWAFALLYSVILAGDEILAAVRGRWNPGRLAQHAIAALIPWIFPIFWMAASYHASGDALGFFHATREFEASRISAFPSYHRYLRAFLAIDPLALAGGGAGLALLLSQRWNNPGVRSYAAFCLFPLLMFACAQGGRPAWSRNYLRYLFPFLALLYPAFCYFLSALSQSLKKIFAPAPIIIAALIAAMASHQIYTAYTAMPPRSGGIKTGERLARLRLHDPDCASGNVLLEASSWRHYLVMVGAGTGVPLLFDRPQPEHPRSVLGKAPAQVDKFLARYDIRLVAVNSPDLTRSLRALPSLNQLEVIGDWTIFKVSARKIAPAGN
jgi:4-amino-4-deoxy-L-arabinose transferase-like glycosyltransferase